MDVATRQAAREDSAGATARIAVALLAVAMAGVAAVACFAADMGPDEGIWNYIRRAWACHGQAPYRDAVDDKTPGIFILFAASAGLLGPNVWLPRLLGCLAVGVASLAVYRIAASLLDRRAGVFAMVLFALSMSWWLLDGPFAAQTETFMVMFQSLALVAVIAAHRTRRQGRRAAGMLAAGLCMGLAISFKQVALFGVVGLFALRLCLGRRPDGGRGLLADTLLAGAGALAGVGVSLVPLLASGVTPAEYLRGAWLVFLGPAAVNYSTSAAERLAGFRQAWMGTRMLLWAPLLALLLLQCRRARALGVPVAGVGLWILFDFLGVNASGNYFGHQFKQVVPSLAVAAGIAVSVLIARVALGKARGRWLSVSAFAAVVIAFLPYKSLNRALFVPLPPDEPRMLGTWIRDRTRPGDHVFLAGDCTSGCTQALAYSQRLAASRYFFWTFFDLPEARRAVLDDLDAKGPRLVLWHKHRSKSLPPWLMEKLESMAGPSYERLPDRHGFAVLQRREEDR